MPIPEQVPKQLRSNRGVIPRWIGVLVLKLMGWSIEGKIPDLNRGLLIGAPHTSNWDFVIAMASILAINLKMFWLAKHTIFVPVIRPIFNWLGGIPTNRDQPIAVVDHVLSIAEKEGSVVIGITPEGTRKKVVKWKTGFLRLARSMNCPIIMVGLSFSKKRVIIGELFYPTGNNAADLVAIREYYQQFDGRYPNQF